MIQNNHLRLVISCLGAGMVTLWSNTPSWAYLGSFAPADGYHIQSATILGDVTYYNAGQYGSNAGGGPGPIQIVADSGLWQLLSPVGGYFPSSALRNAVVGGGPPYPPTPPGTVAAYIVGDHSPGRTDFHSLALRNDTPLGTGAMLYNYDLDSFDFGGIVPSTVSSGLVTMQFYFCPNPGDTPNPGIPPMDKFTLSLRDSLGNVGLEWGYMRDNGVVWRTSSSNPWNTTPLIANSTNWDGVRFTLDLTNDTFELDYYEVSTNTWSNLAPAGTAMGQPMSDFTSLHWQLEDGLFAGTGGKNFFDDFTFIVPEPSGALFLLIAGSFWTMRSRRTRRSI